MLTAYRIKKYHHVSNARQARLRHENLVPLFDLLPNQSLLDDDVDTILSSEEAMASQLDDVRTAEAQINAIRSIRDGDWLIEYNGKEQPMYLMRFNRYEHRQHKHLYVKHFATITHVFSVESSVIQDSSLPILNNADHLMMLPFSVSMILKKYEAVILAQEEKDSTANKTPHKKHQSLKRRKARRVPLFRNGPITIKTGASSTVDVLTNVTTVKPLKLPSFTKSIYTGRSYTRLQKKK